MSDQTPTANPESALHERLYSTDNAAVWAGEFVALHGGDEGLMIGWFANAIETAKRIDRDRHPERKPVMDRDFAVLSRSALLQFFGEMALPPWRDDTGALVGGGIDCALIASRIIEWMEANDLGDLYAQIDGSGGAS